MAVTQPGLEEVPPSAAEGPPTGADAQPPPARWRMLRRFGAAGFLFFLIKGLLWLIVPAVIYLMR